MFYHVTPTKNVPSIQAQGLIPQSGERSQQMEDHGIYLFTSVEDVETAVMNWLGDEFGDEPLSVLRVSLPAGISVTQEAFEVVCHDPIPPECVEDLGDIDGALEENVIRIGQKNTGDPKLEEFMRDFWEQTFNHPLDRTARLLSNSAITVRPWEGKIMVKDIMSLDPGTGGGSAALKFLCDLADKHHVGMSLLAKEYGTRKTMNTKTLRDWYARYGFVAGRGNARYGYDMERGAR